jgi:hypothetical protein
MPRLAEEHISVTILIMRILNDITLVQRGMYFYTHSCGVQNVVV